jgi:hypothetical protein
LGVEDLLRWRLWSWILVGWLESEQVGRGGFGLGLIYVREKSLGHSLTRYRLHTIGLMAYKPSSLENELTKL